MAHTRSLRPQQLFKVVTREHHHAIYWERKETFWSLLLACEPTLETYLTHYSLTATVKLITFAKRASFFSLLDSINSNLISRSHKSYRAEQHLQSLNDESCSNARAMRYSLLIINWWVLSRSLPKELNWIFNFTPKLKLNWALTQALLFVRWSASCSARANEKTFN